MKKLSKFAKKHSVKARLIITFAHIVLPFLAIYFGVSLYDFDVMLPVVLIPLLVGVFFVATCLYPNKKRKSGLFKYSYRRQKSLDLTFVMVYFFLIATSANSIFYEPQANNTATAKPVFIVKTPTKEAAKNNIFQKPAKQIKQFRKSIRAKIRTLKKDKQTNKDEMLGLKILLIFLTVLGAAALGFLIFAFGCNLACSGNEAAAWVVWIGGGLGILAGLFFAIRAIVQMDKDKNVPQTN